MASASVWTTSGPTAAEDLPGCPSSPAAALAAEEEASALHLLPVVPLIAGEPKQTCLLAAACWQPSSVLVCCATCFLVKGQGQLQAGLLVVVLQLLLAWPAPQPCIPISHTPYHEAVEATGDAAVSKVCWCYTISIWPNTMLVQMHIIK